MLLLYFSIHSPSYYVVFHSLDLTVFLTDSSSLHQCMFTASLSSSGGVKLMSLQIGPAIIFYTWLPMTFTLLQCNFISKNRKRSSFFFSFSRLPLLTGVLLPCLSFLISVQNMCVYVCVHVYRFHRFPSSRRRTPHSMRTYSLKESVIQWPSEIKINLVFHFGQILNLLMNSKSKKKI